MKKYEQYKRMVRFFLNAILCGLEMALYLYIWINYYNKLMETPYNRTGHWLIVTVYGIFLLIFSKLYGGLKIGYLRTTNMIYSQTLASISATALIYLQITLLTKHFQYIIPLLVMTLIDIFIISMWSFTSTIIYRKLYPPRKVILVYGERPVMNLMTKLHSRMDRFEVKEVIHVSNGLKKIQKCIDNYDGVIICDVPSHIRNRILKYCYSKSIRTYVTPKISDIIIRSSESLHMFDTPLILTRSAGLTFEQAVFKRLMDIVLSLVALILLSPILVITAIAIKLCDGGPIFYFQDRCTKDGRVFPICKFRSMVVNAEKNGQAIPATERDPRITPVGNIIRKIRIDELPQIFNILKGDMSIVGPRPERVEHVELYSNEIPEFEYRLKVKGGLTGYAQVYGKYNTTAYDKLKLDLMYIQNYSLLLDIEIIFKTIKILFMKESTEGFTEEESATISEKKGEF